MAPSESRQFKRKDAIGLATKGTLIFGGAGLFMSAIQNTLTKQNVGAWGVITKTGGTVGIAGKSAQVNLVLSYHQAFPSFELREDNINMYSGHGWLLHVFP